MEGRQIIKPPDKRLLARGEQLIERLGERRTCVIRQLSADWSEEMGFGRWLGNPKTSLRWLLGQVRSGFGRDRLASSPHVLCIQDTSTIGFKANVGRKTGLKHIGTGESGAGFLIHPTLLLDGGDGRCLGLGDLDIFDQWAAIGGKGAVRQLEAGEKKTGRWLSAGRRVRDQIGGERQLAHIADREADFYEMLVEFGQNRHPNEHLALRVNEDR